MRIKYKTRKTISQILSIVLVCALGLGAIFGVSALSNKLKEDKRTIHPIFEVGGLNNNGEFVKTDASIYTKKAFACQGLEVKLDFDSKVKYSVYYYNDLDNFKGSQTDLTSSEELIVPANASHARIVITPIWEDDIKKNDRVCHWYDVTKYSSQLEVIVNKDQDFVSVNLFVHDPAKENKTVGASYNGGPMKVDDADASKNYAYATIDVKGVSAIKFVFLEGTKSSAFSYDIFNEAGNQIYHGMFDRDKTELIVEIPEGAVTFAFNYGYKSQTFEIYEAK